VDKAPPPLLGFNNNVRHKGRVFHIQTEDSGIKHARIVTHLFADGGRIVKSTRTEYLEHIGRPDLVEVLRRVMKEQHKAMFIRLRAGELDSLIEAACGPLARYPDQVSPSKVNTELKAPPRVEAPAEPDPNPEAPAHARDPASSEPPPSPRRRQLSNPNLRPPPPSVAPPAGDLELDEELLSGNVPVPLRRSASLPEAVATASSTESASAARAEPPDITVRPEEEEVRYASPRPPNIFEAPLTEHTLFGERLIREKSLDEVILSYLADDLDGGSQD
jgi:hypothetical protein